MTALLDAPWRAYPAGALAAFGALLLVWTLRRHAEGLRRPVTDPLKALALGRFLREAILGLALVTLGAAWLWRMPWLVLVAVVVAAEETLEISVVVAALRADPSIAARERSRQGGMR